MLSEAITGGSNWSVAAFYTSAFSMYRQDLMTYGNYCGPGWTGGQYVGEMTDDDYRPLPVDQIDELCFPHDWAYENANSFDDIRAADMDLLEDATNLRDTWTPPTEEARMYLDDLIAAFQIKMTWEDVIAAIGGPEVPTYGYEDLLGGEISFLRIPPDGQIDKLKAFFGQGEAANYSPIILDLDGDGVETVGLPANIHFDHDGNGFAEQTGRADANDRLLVWGRNGNGQIDDGGELFGNNTILANGQKRSMASLRRPRRAGHERRRPYRRYQCHLGRPASLAGCERGRHAPYQCSRSACLPRQEQVVSRFVK